MPVLIKKMSVVETGQNNEDCPICMERPAAQYLLGCNHPFCADCLSVWLVKHTATCPICQLPVYAFTAPSDAKYLTPYHGAFGVRLKKEGPEKAVLVGVEEESVASAIGLEIGTVITVNGVKNYEGIVKILRDAVTTKRMAMVVAHPDPCPTPAACAPSPFSIYQDTSCLRRFLRWARIKTTHIILD